MKGAIRYRVLLIPLVMVLLVTPRPRGVVYGGTGATARGVLTISDVSVLGGLSKDAVSGLVRGHVPALEKYYRGDGSTGQLVMSLAVRPDGSVKSVKVLRGAADWMASLVDEVGAWRFSKTDNGREARVIVVLFVNA